MSIRYRKFDENGQGNDNQFQLDDEPIFCQILYNMVLGQGMILKRKQRIRLPKAAVLIGCIDL